ncbi:MAG: hypothetical protein JSW08_01445 [archaeon]|nr:MAG: hypothetical protein JSW08_01445 [archaeon]
MKSEAASFKKKIGKKRVKVIIGGIGKEILKILPKIDEKDKVILAGFAKSVNKSINVGEVVVANKIQGKKIRVPKEFSKKKLVSLYTADKVVYHFNKKGYDIIDMEAKHLVNKVGNLVVVRAISDSEEDISFLNKFNGVPKIFRPFLLDVTECQSLLRLMRNSKIAGRNLAAYLTKIVKRYS